MLTIATGDADDLTNTTIDTINIAGGSNINVGESMTLIKNNGTLNSIGNVTDTFTAGVAREGLGSTSVENGNVSFKVNSIKLSSQAVSAAQTRAASAATAALFTTAAALLQGTRIQTVYIRKVRSVPVC